ncbi:MAG: alpha/beta fold hydrolase [Acidobacteriota bacterium]
MRKTTFTVIALVLFATCLPMASFGTEAPSADSTERTAYADLAGYWMGVHLRQGSPRFVQLEITVRDGRPAAAVIHPEWASIGEPAAAIEVEGSKVSIRFDEQTAIELELDPVRGEMAGTGTVSGTGDHRFFRAHYKKTFRPALPAIERKALTFEHAGKTFSAELVLPAAPGPHPAMVMFHGRSNGKKESFRDDVVLLARRGVATLAFDRRGEGDSGGDATTATFADLAADGRAAVAALADRPEVDAARLGIYGQSAGGWVAAAVAADNPRVRFVVLNVGPAVSVWEQQAQVSQYRMKRQTEIDFTTEELAAARAHVTQVMEVGRRGEGWDRLAEANARAEQTRWGRFVPRPDEERDFDWPRRFATDPRPYLETITVPLLALYGENDIIVPPEENVPRLEAALQRAGNANYEIVILPQTGHGLALGGATGELGGSDVHFWPRYAPELYSTLFGWLETSL